MGSRRTTSRSRAEISLTFPRVSFRNSILRQGEDSMPTTAVHTQVEFARETHIKDYWRIIVRRKWIVIAFALLTTLVVGVMSFTSTPLYKASATIVIENEESDVLN